MNFSISVIQTETQNKGKYVQLEVAYKRLDTGKLESKKLMSFVKPDRAYQALLEAKPNEQYTVVATKNTETGYWDWTDAVRKDAEGLSTPGPERNLSNTAPTSRSTYETPEERAKKQVYIVKQSSLSNAIAVLSVGSKTPPKAQEVIDLAQEFTNWVMGVPAFSAKQQTNKMIQDLAEMPDDVPL